jgi:hypothetical protein
MERAMHPGTTDAISLRVVVWSLPSTTDSALWGSPVGRMWAFKTKLQRSRGFNDTSNSSVVILGT